MSSLQYYSVYITGIDPSVDIRDLWSFITNHGLIDPFSLVIKQPKNSLHLTNYAFLDYKNKNAAMVAEKVLDGQMLMGQVLSCNYVKKVELTMPAIAYCYFQQYLQPHFTQQFPNVQVDINVDSQGLVHVSLFGLSKMGEAKQFVLSGFKGVMQVSTEIKKQLETPLREFSSHVLVQDCVIQILERQQDELYVLFAGSQSKATMLSTYLVALFSQYYPKEKQKAITPHPVDVQEMGQGAKKASNKDETRSASGSNLSSVSGGTGPNKWHVWWQEKGLQSKQETSDEW